MDYQELKQEIQNYSHQDLEQRKNWYSPAANIYYQVRPKYPHEIIQQVITLTNLNSQSHILEIGTGPGNATVAFAELGLSITGIEPNPEFYRLAQHNCRGYSQVKFYNTSFEELNQEMLKFDAVLAAASFHWIPSDIAYSKAAQVLGENGYLILLWNKELQPSYEIYQSLSPIYQFYAPSLKRQYEDQSTIEQILQGLGQIIVDSCYFHDLVSGQVMSSVIYTTDEYLQLLNTYSSYLALLPETKDQLFEELRNKIDQAYYGRLELFYISAYHIAKKISTN